MNNFEDTEKIALEDKQLVVALGNFDGVHRGHQMLLQKMILYAHQHGALSSALIFNPHPQQVLNPKVSPKLLLNTDQKIEILKQQGVDNVIIIPFDINLSSLSPEEFIEKILVAELQVSGVFVGYDYRFGSKAVGTPELLCALGKEKFFFVEVVPPVLLQGVPISSTLVRQELINGNIEQAKELLGYSPILKGKIVSGNRRGRKLGFPTANVKVPVDILIPKNGVYLGEVLLKGSHHLTVINIGNRPTFGCGERLIEAHLLDFQEDVYGKDIEITLVKRLRDEKIFANQQDLIEQIRKDIEIAVKFYEELEQQQA
ncbi:MAG: bifunctional riboflavin kinase/FAD synthetase [Syntrophaceticus sp.]|nr:bifunctional riboflavin kinase/FAD synthetase [Syntrophaceticus sp.]MDD3313911.1 bifunctional riboflavin kinase/FAD synthetase [Syntrophaceticus sp.]MDD4358989.1 bifunctional riboflavin kinase/FAD synthetase [Syntrophaceticus sp.]MDD4782215.1 bifunctional riboflavin kinase/FAD synthetase [Syntrophaceticus sp.]